MISVIIPTLNEALSLPDLLSDLEAQKDVALEVIVVDGGSTDDTLPIAQDRAHLLHSNQRNRAKQLNLGVSKASGEWLFFVHADTRIRDPFLIRGAVEQLQDSGTRHAGHFSLKFVGPNQDHPGFRFLETKSTLNRPNTTNGDQGFFLRRKLFEELGGFDESLPFLEDQRFAEKLRKVATWITLEGALETSTRRFAAEGFGPRYTLMAIVMAAHEAGLDSFFAAARPYVTHDESKHLDLRPFLEVFRNVTDDLNPREASEFWLNLGRFIRENAWQIALLIDVYVLQNNREDTLMFFDTNVAPLLSRGTFDGATGILTGVLFRQILPTFLDLKDQGVLSAKSV